MPLFKSKSTGHLLAIAIDLRSLNEKQAGDGSFTGVRGSDFVRTKTGQPVRFRGVDVVTSPADDATRAHDARNRPLATPGALR